MDPLDALRDESFRYGYGLRLGRGADGEPFRAEPEHSALVIGPPRSGKTSAIMVPNIVAACGPVVATSTKPDLILTTSPARSRVGECLLFDPSGLTKAPPGIERVAWSPLDCCWDWEETLLVTEAMVRAARPGGAGRSGDQHHWIERAQALIGPCLHAAAIEHMPMTEVMKRLERREGRDFLAVLARDDVGIPHESLDGLLHTEERELSGIWSTASSVLAAYRSPAALAAAKGRRIDFAEFVRSEETLYVCAGSEQQQHCAPIVSGLLREVRSAGYRAAAAGEAGWAAGVPPVLLALDELANIAPLHDLPALVSEGGSQGVVTLACVQDLSQVVERWGQVGEGFLSVFNNKLILPGIGDSRTLEAISLLGGDREVRAISYAEGERAAGLGGLLGRRRPGRRTVSTRVERRLPPDLVAQGSPGHAVLIEGATPWFVEMTPWFRDPALCAALGERAAGRVTDRGHDRSRESARAVPELPDDQAPGLRR
jgi:type IV secretory pathway TraG/TraD family ATPase VirD4